MSSGVGGIWAMKPGDFIATEFAGTAAGITAALAFAGAGGAVYVGPGTYDLSAPITPVDGVTLFGAGKTSILRDTGGFSILDMTGVDDFVIRDLAFTTSFAGSFTAGRGAIWSDVSAAATRGLITGCFINGVWTCGIAMKANEVRIIGNDVRTTKEHGIYLSESNDCLVANNVCKSNGSIGSGGQMGIKFANCTRCVASANVVLAPEHGGIVFDLTTTNCAAIGNSFRDCPTYSVRFTGGSNNVAIGNVCRDSTLQNIYVSGGVKHLIAENMIDCGTHLDWQIRIDSGCTECVVRGNKLIGQLTAGIGIRIAGNNAAVESNYLNSTVGTGIQVASGTTGAQLINNRILAPDATRYDDLGTGTVIIEPVGRIQNVASAATVTLPAGGSDFITITGTTTITSITASWIGRRVTLHFSGALTVTDGSNLLLAGNFVTTADDTLSLVCTGTNWVEVSRSVN